MKASNVEEVFASMLRSSVLQILVVLILGWMSDEVLRNRGREKESSIRFLLGIVYLINSFVIFVINGTLPFFLVAAGLKQVYDSGAASRTPNEMTKDSEGKVFYASLPPSPLSLPPPPTLPSPSPKDCSQSVSRSWSLKTLLLFGKQNDVYPRGIKNDGSNTCFLNSCLQCLARAPGFLEGLRASNQVPLSHLESDGQQQERKDFVCSLIELLGSLRILKQKGSHVSNVEFRSIAHVLNPSLIASPADGYQRQTDVGEFLLWLLDVIDETVKTTSEAHSDCHVDSLTMNDIGEDVRRRRRRRGRPRRDGYVNGTAGNNLFNLENAELATEKLFRVLEAGGSGNFYENFNLSFLIRAKNFLSDCLLWHPASPVLSSLFTLGQLQWAILSREESSIVKSTFGGLILEMKKCLLCDSFSAIPETFYILPVSLTSNLLESCLASFGQPERLGPDDALPCPSCKKRGRGEAATVTSSLPLGFATRQALIHTTPRCLIIQLQRFSYNVSLHKVDKCNAAIDFPVEKLDISPIMLNCYRGKASASTERNGGLKEEAVYTLYAFCCHLGKYAASYGHYITYCRHIDDESLWYKFDDKHVTKIANIEVEKQKTRETVYLLFYKKVFN